MLRTEEILSTEQLEFGEFGTENSGGIEFGVSSRIRGTRFTVDWLST